MRWMPTTNFLAIMVTFLREADFGELAGHEHFRLTAGAR